MKRALPVERPLELAPIQDHLLKRATAQGCTLDAALGRLGAIIKEGEPADALVGIRTLFDYTVGRPATTAKTLNLHASTKGDKFFEAALFEKPPPPMIED